MEMSGVIALTVIAVMLVVFWRFGYRDERVEPYEEAVLDVEGRLDWAHSRAKPLPPGMESQLARTSKLLEEAKALWAANKWDRAVKKAWAAQKSMTTAQDIFIQANNARQNSWFQTSS